MEVKVFPNRIILWVRGDPSPYPGEKEQVENFIQMLKSHGIEFTFGKQETLKDNNANYGIHTVIVLHLIFDDVNFTAYKLIKD